MDQVDLTIPRGIYGLLGENGAGKTTLMRVLTTVLTPKEGEIWLDHIRYEPQQYETIKRKLGYLPQELNLYPGLSVRECLEYLGELSQIPKNICKKDELTFDLEKTGFCLIKKRRCANSPAGMKRRVGLIQAMLGEPEFLIVDEPTTGLDPEERVRIRNLLVDFAKGRTVLFSTHVVEDIAATCSNLAVMRKGTFLYTGTVQDLLNHAKGKIWMAAVSGEDEARGLEAKYHITSKQYTEEGMTVQNDQRYPAGRAVYPAPNHSGGRVSVSDGAKRNIVKGSKFQMKESPVPINAGTGDSALPYCSYTVWESPSDNLACIRDQDKGSRFRLFDKVSETYCLGPV